MSESIATEVARLVGLHTPVPDRYETMSDELLEHYVYGLEKVVFRDDLTSVAKVQIVCAVNEFLKACLLYTSDAADDIALV